MIINITGFRNVTPRRPTNISVAAGYIVTSVPSYQFIRRHILEDRNVNTHGRDDIWCHTSHNIMPQMRTDGRYNAEAANQTRSCIPLQPQSPGHIAPIMYTVGTVQQKLGGSVVWSRGVKTSYSGARYVKTDRELIHFKIIHRIYIYIYTHTYTHAHTYIHTH